MTNEESTLSGRMVNGLMDYAIKTINDADQAAAAKTAEQARTKNPDLTIEEVADILIKRKCFSTGAVGAITSGVSILPGIGTVVALTFGAAADMSMTFKQRAELVLEISALYGHTLTPQDKRNAILLVTGIGAGSQQLAVKGGEKIAQKATETLASQAAAKAIPFIGVGVSAGTNILTTYVIGERAKRYFGRDLDELEDWADSLVAITGADELRIGEWLSETTVSSYNMVSSTAQDVAGGVVVAGQKSGELVLIAANQTSQGVTALVGTVGGAASSASQFLVDGGKLVGQSVLDAGKWTGATAASAGQGVVDISGDVAGRVTDTVATSADSASQTAKGLWNGVANKLWGDDDSAEDGDDSDKVA